jgi:lysylphosphatidylglycerol synthetase-like protein (DUF2156 family)
MLAVALLAAVNWVLTPEDATRWLRAMLALPSLWLVLTLWRFFTLRSLRKPACDEAAAVTRYFAATLSLVVVGIGIWQVASLSIETWVRLADSGAHPETERRVLGVAAGAVLVFIGNAMPKILTPFSMLPPDLAARVTAARRFVGTSAVLLGSTTILAFLVAPTEIAGELLRWALGASAVAFVGAIVWMNLSPSRRER